MDDFSLIILDLVQNSIAANAKHIEIKYIEKPSSHQLFLVINDDGCGMTESVINKVTDPFYTTRKTRKVGLGLAYLKQLTEMTEGSLVIQSKTDLGTSIEASFLYNHIDLPPLGDITDTLYILLCHQASFDFTYIQTYEETSININRNEVINLLNGLMITDYQVQKAIKAFMDETIQKLKGETQ